MSAMINVRLGSRSPVQVAVEIDGEFTPDEVFIACNRIEDTARDIAGLDHDWQRTLRWHIDVIEAPSMSVGDQFELLGPRGPIGRWVVTSDGWKTIGFQS